MESGKTKKSAGTAAAAAIVSALIVLCAVFSDYSLTALQRDTLKILMIICGCSVLYCFAVSQITKNYSQMDKLWSILPVAYVWVIAVKGGMKLRLVVYALIVTAWGIRLTINFARKGAYRLKFWLGEEDYRWSIVHQSPVLRNGAAWTLFNLLFISFYQNALVLAICIPAAAGMESHQAFGAWDIAAAVFAVLFLILETAADEYQWRFQQEKKRLLAENGSLEKLPAPYDLGFNTTGPWSRMRHPNYLGEQGIWMSLYFTAAGAGVTRKGIFHWSMIGPLLLILLFMGSSTLGERISSGKYPLYKKYTAQVFKYLPLRKFERE